MQKSPDGLVESDRLRTGQFERAIKGAASAVSATTEATSSEKIGWKRVDGSRMVSPSVAASAIP